MVVSFICGWGLMLMLLFVGKCVGFIWLIKINGLMFFVLMWGIMWFIEKLFKFFLWDEICFVMIFFN